MAKHVQINRMGSIAAASYVGNEGELIVDTGDFSIRVQDGATPGGHRIGPGGTLWSSALVVAFGAKSEWNHGASLAAKSQIRGVLVCISTHANYAVGDEIHMGSDGQNVTNHGATLGADAGGDRIFAMFGGAGYYLRDKTTGADTMLDVTKWRLYLGYVQ